MLGISAGWLELEEAAALSNLCKIECLVECRGNHDRYRFSLVMPYVNCVCQHCWHKFNIEIVHAMVFHVTHLVCILAQHILTVPLGTFMLCVALAGVDCAAITRRFVSTAGIGIALLLCISYLCL
jgi:hypothetical protein